MVCLDDICFNIMDRLTNFQHAKKILTTPTPVKSRTLKSAGKVILIWFLDIKDAIMKNRLSSGNTDGQYTLLQGSPSQTKRTLQEKEKQEAFKIFKAIRHYKARLRQLTVNNLNIEIFFTLSCSPYLTPKYSCVFTHI